MLVVRSCGRGSVDGTAVGTEDSFLCIFRDLEPVVDASVVKVVDEP